MLWSYHVGAFFWRVQKRVLWFFFLELELEVVMSYHGGCWILDPRPFGRATNALKHWAISLAFVIFKKYLNYIYLFMHLCECECMSAFVYVFMPLFTCSAQRTAQERSQLPPMLLTRLSDLSASIPTHWAALLTGLMFFLIINKLIINISCMSIHLYFVSFYDKVCVCVSLSIYKYIKPFSFQILFLLLMPYLSLMEQFIIQ